MAEDGHPHVILRIFLADAVSVIHRAAVLLALGNNHDTAVLALAESPADELLQLVHIRLVLRDDGSLGTGSDGTVLCQETGIPAHYLDEEDAVVGSGRVADLVHAVNYGIEGGVISDSGVSAVEVIVNGSRKSDDRIVIFPGEFLRSCERAVTSYDNQCINTELDEIVVGLLHSLRSHKLHAPRCLEDCATPLDGIAHALGGELLDFSVDEALISTIDAHHFHSVENSRPGDGPDAGIHSRRITSRCKDADRLNLFSHIKFCFPLSIFIFLTE